MATLSVQQAASYASAAGFSGQALNIVIAIAQAESSLNTQARHVNAGGSVDRGILQINNVYHAEVSDACAYDPACAFGAGYKIASGGSNFTPWSTYNSGAYKQYLQQLPGGDPTAQGKPAWFTHSVSQNYSPPGEYGVDLGMPVGTPITALFAGTVGWAGRTCWGSGCVNGSSGGEVTVICSVPGYGAMTSYYLHMDSLAPGIRAGVVVQAGQVIAYSGGQLSGGNWPVVNIPSRGLIYSTGPHVEFGFNAPWINGPGRNVNPIFAIDAARSGQLGLPLTGPTTGNPLADTTGTGPGVNLIQAGLLSFLSLSELTHQTATKIEGFDGVVLDIDYTEQLQPFNMLNPFGSIIVNFQAIIFRSILVIMGCLFIFATVRRAMDTDLVQGLTTQAEEKSSPGQATQAAQTVQAVAPAVAAAAI